MASQQKREDSARTAPKPAQVRKSLGGFDYSDGKGAPHERVRRENADENVMAALECVPDHESDSPTAGSREVSYLD